MLYQYIIDTNQQCFYLIFRWNNRTISVALIGNFQYEFPTEYALGNFEMLLRYLSLNKLVVKNFTLYAMCEVRNTVSPGRNLYNRINALDKKSYPMIGQHLVINTHLDSVINFQTRTNYSIQPYNRYTVNYGDHSSKTNQIFHQCSGKNAIGQLYRIVYSTEHRTNSQVEMRPTSSLYS